MPYLKRHFKRNDIPKIIILNPSPETIVERFVLNYGIPKRKILKF